MTNAVSIAQSGSNNVTMRNKIINGAMVIDQRNAGASVTPTTDNVTFPVDRFVCRLSQASKFSAQQSSTAPAGFTKSLLITSLSAYSVGSSEFFAISQNIEGFNTADLGWGTSDAQAVTLSFKVRSSLTGTFGGTVYNSNADTSYPFTYSISSANTWTSISVVIPGATTGSWLGGNVVGINVSFSLGAGSSVSGTANTWAGSLYRSATGATSVVGTNGATFYITGVQLEEGTAASPFENRLYGTELNLCQRYYFKVTATGYYPCIGLARGSTITRNTIAFPVPMRVVPTALSTTGTASDYSLVGDSVLTCTSVPTLNDTTTIGGVIGCTVSGGGLITGYPYLLQNNASPNSFLAWSAEL